MLHVTNFETNTMSTNSDNPGGASQEAISYHYDRGVDFYQLWLGEAFCYSAGSFVDPQTRKVVRADYRQAQLANVDAHLASVGARNDFRLLDIGCGWGTLLKRASLEFGVRDQVGLTLSSEQKLYVSELELPSTEVRLESYEDFVPETPFDGITCVEALEHFAKAGLSREEKVQCYQGFFDLCHSWLKPKGMVSMQFGMWGTANREMADRIVPRDVFPESDLPYFDEIVEASEGRFDLIFQSVNTEDYVQTLSHWRQTLQQKMNSVVSESDIETYHFYDRYLRRALAGFKRDRIRLCRCLFRAK